MNAHRAFGLSVLVVALMAGCSTSPPSSTPVAEATSQTSEGIDYGSWSAVTPQPIRVPKEAFYRCSATPDQIARGPHFAPAVKVYANPTALSALQSTATWAMPVGSVVVKEKWWDEKASQPSAYAAMFKRDAGYDPDNGDWEYLFAQLDGGRKVQRGRIQNCIACHQGAAPQDYLFRTYLGFDKPDQKK
jgi:hypothetical protein